MPPEVLSQIVRHCLDGPNLEMTHAEAKMAFERRYFFKLMVAARGSVPKVNETAQMSHPPAVRQKMQALGLWPRALWVTVLEAAAGETKRRKEEDHEPQG